MDKHPNLLDVNVKRKWLKQAYSKNKAIKYLVAKGLHFKLDKKLFNHLVETGRLLPDVGNNKFSRYNLERYYYETKPR
ncbi:hypothetical protein M5361_13830 [Ligilactobacillus agilis]|nr:hypothetical protein [Ligilactobacillus agilis]